MAKRKAAAVEGTQAGAKVEPAPPTASISGKAPSPNSSISGLPTAMG